MLLYAQVMSRGLCTNVLLTFLAQAKNPQTCSQFRIWPFCVSGGSLAHILVSERKRNLLQINSLSPRKALSVSGQYYLIPMAMEDCYSSSSRSAACPRITRIKFPITTLIHSVLFAAFGLLHCKVN